MKRVLYITLLMALIAAVAAPLSFAQDYRTLADTSKKGSLLIWPLITTYEVSTQGPYFDTLISIQNDYPAGVYLQCYWVYKEGEDDCVKFDVGFQLTASQPIAFWASDGFDLTRTYSVADSLGPGIEKAELKCWAYQEMLDDEETPTGSRQISWNHLTGTATVFRLGIDGLPDLAYQYNAWSFAANATFKSAVGTLGSMDLTGLTGAYDACPETLWFDVEKQTTNPDVTFDDNTVNNVIALVPCKQDLTQEGGFTRVKADILRWDENEGKRSGSWICFTCLEHRSLADLDSPGQNPFIFLNTYGAAFSVTSPAETSAGPCGETSGSPMIGVQVKQYYDPDGPITATTPTVQGVAPVEGAILYDPS